MIRLIGVELMKLVTTRRTTAIFLAVSAGLCLLFTLVPLLATDSVTSDQDVLDLLASGQIAALVLLILGAVNMGGEARHGTQVATFLATPVRWKVVVAKSVAHALAGLVAGALNAAMGLLSVALFADAPWPDGGDLVLQILGSLGVTALLASFGVAMGAILRNQAAAVAGTLVFLLIIEPLLSAFIDVVDKYGISASELAMTTPGGDDGVAQGVGALVLLGWVLVVTAGALAAIERRDIRG
jgi:ABC-2 type transport system permease protein